MNHIDLNTYSLDALKKIALEFPSETISSIESQLKLPLDKKLFSKAYFLLSLSYKTTFNHKKELECLCLAIDTAIDVEEKIKALVRKSGYYIDNNLCFDAYKDLSQAEILFNTLKSHDTYIGLTINLTKCHLFLSLLNIIPLEILFYKIDNQIQHYENKYISAHFNKTKAIYYFRIHEYSKSIYYLDLACKFFLELKLINEISSLDHLYAICKFKLNDPTFKLHQLNYENFLNKQNNTLLQLRYLSAINQVGVNPIAFYQLPIDQYLFLANIFLERLDYKNASILYLRIANYYDAIGNIEQSFLFFKKHSEINLKVYQDEEEIKLIELHIHRELQLYSKSPSPNSDPNSSKVIKDYVASNMGPFLANEKGEWNYKIMSNLMIEQFKTQVSICTNYGIKFLETNNIQVLESDGNYTILYDKDAKRHISSKPLAYYEKQLDPKQFLRTHRSYIINTNYIVHFFPGRVGKIELANGQIIEVSARKMAEVRRRILN